MECIEYKKGYKYQIVDGYVTTIPMRPATDLRSPSGYIELSQAGVLKIKKGYAWDGPSGPTFDTLDFMRGSLVHDALYQLMREKLLDKAVDRQSADKLLQRMCRDDGMCFIRAWWVYIGLKFFGDPAADPANKRPVTKAPAIVSKR